MENIILFITYCLVVSLLCISNTLAQDSTKVKKKWGWGVMLVPALTYTSITNLRSNSTAQPGGGLILGGFTQKKIGKRWAIRLGLQVAYRSGVWDSKQYHNSRGLIGFADRINEGKLPIKYEAHCFYLESNSRIIYHWLNKEKIKFYTGFGILAGAFLYRYLNEYTQDFSTDVITTQRSVADGCSLPLPDFGLQLSMGVSYKINNNQTIIIEPVIESASRAFLIRCLYGGVHSSFGVGVGLIWH